MTIINSLLENNVASDGPGGGVWLQRGSRMEVFGSAISRNTAEKAGADVACIGEDGMPCSIIMDRQSYNNMKDPHLELCTIEVI